MEKAIFFALLSLIILGVLLYFLILYRVLHREKRAYTAKGENYLSSLRERYRRSRLRRVKNLRLYLLVLALEERNEKEEASRLAPFLRPDPLMGVVTRK